MTSPPRVLQTLVGRYDRTAFEPAGGRARVRLSITDGAEWDAVIADPGARLVPAEGGPDALLAADARRGGRSPTTSAAGCAPTSRAAWRSAATCTSGWAHAAIAAFLSEHAPASG